jgi:hypothetical protein
MDGQLVSPFPHPPPWYKMEKAWIHPPAIQPIAIKYHSFGEEYPKEQQPVLLQDIPSLTSNKIPDLIKGCLDSLLMSYNELLATLSIADLPMVNAFAIILWHAILLFDRLKAIVNYRAFISN